MHIGIRQNDLAEVELDDSGDGIVFVMLDGATILSISEDGIELCTLSEEDFNSGEVPLKLDKSSYPVVYRA